MEFSRIDRIIKGIRRYYGVSDKSIEEMAELMEEHHFPKHHLLTKAGCLNHYIYFIQKGCTRTYLLVDGKEITNWFSREGDITFSSNALYHGTEGFEYVEVLENSVIFSMPIKALNKLYERNIEVVNWSRIIHQEVLLEMQTLRIDRLSHTSKERYDKFVQNNPDLINRVNLGYIASYLGMTQQHLSAIRANE